MAEAVKEKPGLISGIAQAPGEGQCQTGGPGHPRTATQRGRGAGEGFRGDGGSDVDPADAGVRSSGGDFAAAKPMAEDPRFVERFEIFIAGMECGDNWAEQNDPALLLETFRQAPTAPTSGPTRASSDPWTSISSRRWNTACRRPRGIGPGIERMAMIFTEQENIDDVIFFPMMRPSLSPLNAAIYDITESALAPVEDLALSWEDCENAVQRGRAQTARAQSGGASHVRHWGAARASGHVEIEGFCPTACCGLAGFRIKAGEPSFEAALVQFLKSKFPGSHIRCRRRTVSAQSVAPHQPSCCFDGLDATMANGGIIRV